MEAATAAPPAKPETRDEPDYPGDLALEGSSQLSFDVGGKAPTTASVRLIGGKVDLPSGQYSKGERVVLTVEAEVEEVTFRDEKDPKTRQVIGCERRHKARITGVEQV